MQAGKFDGVWKGGAGSVHVFSMEGHTKQVMVKGFCILQGDGLMENLGQEKTYA